MPPADNLRPRKDRAAPYVVKKPQPKRVLKMKMMKQLPHPVFLWHRDVLFKGIPQGKQLRIKYFPDDSVFKSQFTCKRSLGAGAFGTCNLVEFNSTPQFAGAVLALKSVLVDDEEVMQFLSEPEGFRKPPLGNLGNALAEYAVYQEVSRQVGDGVVQLLDAALVKEADMHKLYFLMPVMAGGDLNSRQKSATTAEKVKWMYQIARTFEKLHSRNMVHRDLHAGNVLIDANGNAKLADFGQSCFNKECGTFEADEPQIPAQVAYDVFSLAVLGYHIFGAPGEGDIRDFFEDLGVRVMCAGSLQKTWRAKFFPDSQCPAAETLTAADVAERLCAIANTEGLPPLDA